MSTCPFQPSHEYNMSQLALRRVSHAPVSIDMIVTCASQHWQDCNMPQSALAWDSHVPVSIAMSTKCPSQHWHVPVSIDRSRTRQKQASTCTERASVNNNMPTITCLQHAPVSVDMNTTCPSQHWHAYTTSLCQPQRCTLWDNLLEGWGNYGYLNFQQLLCSSGSLRLQQKTESHVENKKQKHAWKLSVVSAVDFGIFWYRWLAKSLTARARKKVRRHCLIGRSSIPWVADCC